METTQSKNGTTIKITGNWETQAKQLKQQFSQLSESDLKFEEGKEEELLTRLQTKLGKKRDEVISIIEKTQMESAL